ncbi:MAG: type IV pilus biogenesis/stability protein PilW [Pirellulales bacterium]
MSLAAGHSPHATSAERRAARSRSMPTYAADVVVALLLVLITAAVYAPVGDHEFIYYDDPAYVTHNKHVNTGLTPENLWWAVYASHAANWHPLTWWSHMLDVELFELEPRGHHLVNVGLHIVNTVLLFIAWRLLLTASVGGEPSRRDATESPPRIALPTAGRALTFWLPAFIAAVFAWHPLHVQSVAWIAERKDMLSGLFFMLTLIAYTWYVRSPRWRGDGSDELPARARRTAVAIRYALVATALTLGLLCKPSLVTVPFVLWLLDYWPLGRWRSATAAGKWLWRGAAWRFVDKLPLLAIVAAVSVATVVAQRGGGSVQRLSVLPIWPRLANVGIAYWAYIRLTFWPTDLAIFYPHPFYIEALTWQRAALSASIVAVISLVVAWQWRRRPWLPVGWLWFIGMLVPMIGILQVGDQSYADRYTYLTQTGVVLMVAATAIAVASRLTGGLWVVAALGLAALAGCLWRTSVEVGYWQNHERLFRHALEVTERNYIAGVSLGREMMRQDRIEEAIAFYDQARHDGFNYFDAHQGLAKILGARGTERLNAGDTAGGLADLRRLMRSTPSAKLSMPEHEVWVKYGNNLAWYLATDPGAQPLSPDEALRVATTVCQAFEIAPAEYLDTLAAAYAAAGQFSKAVETTTHAIAMAQHEAALPTTDAARKEQLRSLANILSTRLPRYWELKPYREPWPTSPAPSNGADSTQSADPDTLRSNPDRPELAPRNSAS